LGASITLQTLSQNSNKARRFANDLKTPATETAIAGSQAASDEMTAVY
jgi:hypothetical protein